MNTAVAASVHSTPNRTAASSVQSAAMPAEAPDSQTIGTTINAPPPRERWGASVKMRRQLSSSTKSTAWQRCRASSNVSSLVVNERHVYWIEAGLLRRREKG